MKQFSFRQILISFILKGIVIVSAIIGTIFSAKAGIDSFMGGHTVFMYLFNRVIIFNVINVITQWQGDAV